MQNNIGKGQKIWTWRHRSPWFFGCISRLFSNTYKDTSAQANSRTYSD